MGDVSIVRTGGLGRLMGVLSAEGLGPQTTFSKHRVRSCDRKGAEGSRRRCWSRKCGVE